MARNVDYSEAPPFFRKSLKICFDEYLDCFFAGVNFDANG
jgi:hypothetical protein